VLGTGRFGGYDLQPAHHVHTAHRALGLHQLAHDGKPDRVDERMQDVDAPLNEPNPETFYSAGPAGYTDYPFLDRAVRPA